MEGDGTMTLVDALRNAAVTAPSQVAFTMVEDSASLAIDYATLDYRARALAARIQQRASAGARIAILLEPGAAYVTSVFGILYAGAVPVPLYPPTKRNAQRLSSILADAEPAGIVAGDRCAADRVPALDPSWWRLDPECDGSPDEWQMPSVTQDSLALLQYTSGSTARPKGVMLTHGQLFQNHLNVAEVFGLTASSRIVGWLPPFHDMGLMGHIFEPVFSRIPAALLPPATFMADPLRWLKVISEYRATVSGGPNTAYDLCVERISETDANGLRLDSWTTAFNGSECVRHSTMAAFLRKFGRCGFSGRAFVPCYGLAEATLLVSAHRPAAVERDGSRASYRTRSVESRQYVSCGRTAAATRLAIVEPESGRACAPLEIGEIWISGGTVARGYWNRLEESARVFRNALDGDGTFFLRTGDLGFIDDGELYVTGRLRDVIIVGGTNYHAEDIEHEIAASHPGLARGRCAAFATDDGGSEGIVIVQELPRQPPHPDLRVLRDAIGTAVSRCCTVPPRDVVFVRRGGIPRTSSGKTQRHECRRRYLQRELPVVPVVDAPEVPLDHPSSAVGVVGGEALVEEEVASLCRSMLGLSRIDRDASLLALGVDSLLASRLLVRLADRFDVKLPMRSLFGSPTIAGIARAIEASRSSTSVRVAPVVSQTHRGEAP